MARIGNQAPTQSRILPYDKSDGRRAINEYQKSGRTAQKWQGTLIDNILGTNEDGLWTHTKFGYSLPRRNGKNEVVVIRELYGLLKGEKILHTAHRTTTSHSAWERLIRVMEEAGLKEKEDYKKLAQFGLERIEMIDGEGSVSFRTRTTTGGLGEGFDLLVIDEAQEYTDDQESALKYVVTDSMNPQTIYCGTPPTPLSSGTVFVNLRANTLSGGTPNGGWAEWGVENQTDPYDKEAWYLTNPSLGTIFTERSIQDEIGTDEIDFNIQRLGYWISYNLKSAISETDWNLLNVNGKIPKLRGGLHVGIKYGNDGENVALSVAVKTASNKIFVEGIDCRPIRAGNDWILNFLLQTNPDNVIIDGASMQNILAEEIKDINLDKPVLPTVKEIINANSSWEQAIFNKQIRHNNQPSLTNIVTNCDKRAIGSNGGFGYKSQYDDMDIALMDSAILAHWSCESVKKKTKQKIWY